MQYGSKVGCKVHGIGNFLSFSVIEDKLATSFGKWNWPYDGLSERSPQKSWSSTLNGCKLPANLNSIANQLLCHKLFQLAIEGLKKSFFQLPLEPQRSEARVKALKHAKYKPEIFWKGQKQSSTLGPKHKERVCSDHFISDKLVIKLELWTTESLY